MTSLSRGLLALGVLAALYVGVLSALAPGLADLVSLVALAVVMALSGWWIARQARRRAGSPVGRAWWAAAVSALSASLAFCVWAGHVLLDRQLPVPSLTDILFVVAALSLVIAPLLLYRPRGGRGEQVHALLDGAIVATALFLLSWHLVIGPILRSLDRFDLGTAVLVALPLANVVAVTVGLTAASRCQGEQRQSLVLLVSGILALAAGGTLYGYLSLEGRWHPAHPAGALWFVAFPLMAVGATKARPGGTANRRESARQDRKSVV